MWLPGTGHGTYRSLLGFPVLSSSMPVKQQPDTAIGKDLCLFRLKTGSRMLKAAQHLAQIPQNSQEEEARTRL